MLLKKVIVSPTQAFSEPPKASVSGGEIRGVARFHAMSSADEIRSDLREALDAGDISMHEYIREMKKLRGSSSATPSSHQKAALASPQASTS